MARLLSALFFVGMAAEVEQHSLLHVRGGRLHVGTNPLCSAEIRELPVAAKGCADANCQDVTRVMMSDYPSTGSSWLRTTLRLVAVQAGLHAPNCAIYKPKKGGALSREKAFENVYCRPGWTREMGGALVKTHFPAQEIFQGVSLANSVQYEASSHFDKLLVLLRDPRSTIDSNVNRWGGSISTSLAGWAQWWERTVEALPAENVLYVYYEDLCLKHKETLMKVAHFLGGRYQEISDEAYHLAEQEGPEHFKCIYNATNLEQQALQSRYGSAFDMSDSNFWTRYRSSGTDGTAIVQLTSLGDMPFHANVTGLGRNPWIATPEMFA